MTTTFPSFGYGSYDFKNLVNFPALKSSTNETKFSLVTSLSNLYLDKSLVGLIKTIDGTLLVSAPT